MTDDRTDTFPAAPVYERWCVHPGCSRWGSFGKELSRGQSGYWCKEHLPTDYWDNDRGSTLRMDH